jgi:pyridoxal 5'-phosphate synthase pdxS subunit
MQLGAETVFVGSGIFKSEDPEARAKAVVEATTHYQDPEKVLEASTGLKSAMKGLDMSEIPEDERLQERGCLYNCPRRRYGFFTFKNP